MTGHERVSTICIEFLMKTIPAGLKSEPYNRLTIVEEELILTRYLHFVNCGVKKVT